MKPPDPKIVASIVFAAALGLVAVILPVFLHHVHLRPAPLFPVVATGIKKLSSLTLVLLFASGFLVGLVGRGHPLLLGACTMALFPILAFAEMLSDHTSHNLFPIEFILYAVISLAAVAGAFLGRFLWNRFAKR